MSKLGYLMDPCWVYSVLVMVLNDYGCTVLNFSKTYEENTLSIIHHNDLVIQSVITFSPEVISFSNKVKKKQQTCNSPKEGPSSQ